MCVNLIYLCGFFFFFTCLQLPGASDCHWRRSFPNLCLQHMLNWAKFSTGLVCLTHSLKICAVGEEKDFSQIVFQLLLLWVIPVVVAKGGAAGGRWLKVPSVQIKKYSVSDQRQNGFCSEAFWADMMVVSVQYVCLLNTISAVRKWAELGTAGLWA